MNMKFIFPTIGLITTIIVLLVLVNFEKEEKTNLTEYDNKNITNYFENNAEPVTTTIDISLVIFKDQEYVEYIRFEDTPEWLYNILSCKNTNQTFDTLGEWFESPTSSLNIIINKNYKNKFNLIKDVDYRAELKDSIEKESLEGFRIYNGPLLFGGDNTIDYKHTEHHIYIHNTSTMDFIGIKEVDNNLIFYTKDFESSPIDKKIFIDVLTKA